MKECMSTHDFASVRTSMLSLGGALFCLLLALVWHCHLSSIAYAQTEGQVVDIPPVLFPEKPLIDIVIDGSGIFTEWRNSLPPSERAKVDVRFKQAGETIKKLNLRAIKHWGKGGRLWQRRDREVPELEAEFGELKLKLEEYRRDCSNPRTPEKRKSCKEFALQLNARRRYILGKAKPLAEDIKEYNATTRAIAEQAQTFASEELAPLVQEVQRKAQIAKAIAVSGNVRELDPSGGASPVQVGSPLSGGRTYETGPSGAVRIAIGGTSTLTAAPGTSFRLEAAINPSASFRIEEVLHIAKGKVRLVVEKIKRLLNRRFRVRTPNAVDAVQGTDLIAEVDDDQTRFIVIEGEVEAAPALGGEQRIFSTGQTAIFRANGTVTIETSPPRAEVENRWKSAPAVAALSEVTRITSFDVQDVHESEDELSLRWKIVVWVALTLAPLAAVIGWLIRRKQRICQSLT